jgi:hypothetical protein
VRARASAVGIPLLLSSCAGLWPPVGSQACALLAPGTDLQTQTIKHLLGTTANRHTGEHGHAYL